MLTHAADARIRELQFLAKLDREKRVDITVAVEDPDRLDISRAERGHLALGHGIHFCLGAPLARLEAEIAFTTLLAGCPDLALAVRPEELSWRHSRSVRGLRHLPVTFTPSRAP